MEKKIMILIVVLVLVFVVAPVILGALFSLGVFSSGPVTPLTSCVPASGYLCTSPALHSGTFSATVGQSTGVSWTQANIFFVIQGSPAATAVPPLPCEEGFSSGIGSGQTVTVSLSEYANSNTCAGFPTAPGTTVSGTLWASYTTPTNSTAQLIKLAVVTIRAS